jgi:hypothetical protein
MSKLLSLPIFSCLLVEQAEIEMAVEIFALAMEFPFVFNSQWFECIFGREISTAAKTLPIEIIEAAQKRGRERDLWKTAKELLAELDPKPS